MGKNKGILWQPIASKAVFKTSVCTVCEKESISPNGEKKTFTSFKAPDWVIIVPVFKNKDGEDNFIMVKQWRHGSEAVFTEFPGGVIDEGETPEKAARRELLEETGKNAAALTLLAALSPNPAIMENKCYVFYAEVKENTAAQRLDEDEFINILTVPVKTAIKNMGIPPYSHAIMNAALLLYVKEFILTDGKKMNTIQIEKIEKETAAAVGETIEKSELKAGDIFVIGCSTSEIAGGSIGKCSNTEIGETVIKAALDVLNPKGIYLAVQGCEHINRSLVINRLAAERYGFEEVSVMPVLHAGGAAASAAYNNIENAVMVEHIAAKAGIDIGDTEIGMHIKFVQVPLRLENNIIGAARVTALKSRSKLIGGERAAYAKPV